jgi:hypothetical protein
MVDITGIGGIVSAASEIIGKFVPDADKRIEAQIELAKIADGAAERADERLQGQIETNKIEAANPNLFVSGWRPFIGWVGGVTLAWSFLGAPIVHLFLPHQPLPAVDANMIMDMVYALLGIGGMRTYEKIKGVATAAAPPPLVTSSDNIVTRTVGKWFK